MRRLSTFIFGMVVGGLLIYVALNYHLIHAQDGLHMVPKIDAALASTYVDVRGLGIADLAQYPEVAMAISKAGRQDLLESIAGNAIGTEVDRLAPILK
jgi:hypothetical protein